MNTIISVIVIVIFIIFINKILFSMAKPLYHEGKTIKEFPYFFTSLMFKGQKGSHIYITHETSGKIIQFTKKIDETNETLLFTYTHDQSQKENYEKIMKIFDKNSIAYQTTKSDADSDFIKYVNVPNIYSIENAVEITKHVLNAMGIDSEDSFTIHFDGPLIISLKTIKVNLEKYKKYL